MTTLFDRPINGDIRHWGSKDLPVQHDPEEFEEKLDAVLDIEGVEAVRWSQYTPYFNDGEACEFGISEARVRITGGDPEGGDYADGFLSTYDFIDNYGTWTGSYFDTDRTIVGRTYHTIEGVDGAILGPVLSELDKEFAHQEVLLKKTFGDPAEVTATKDGFTVEFYDHD